MAVLSRGTRGRGGPARTWLCVLPLAVMLAPVCAAETTMEYRVKAAFLYNFARFVEWPEARRGDPLVIGVLGADPLHKVLVETVRGKSVDDRPIQVRRLTGVEGATSCAIVFVSASERLPLA